MISIRNLDHLVLTVASIEKTVEFYTQILGMQVETFDESRKALRFGDQKINLHQSGNEYEPKSSRPTEGSADLCFIADDEISDVAQHLDSHHVTIIEGPVRRTGAVGEIDSIYCRDPDGNLVEISHYR